MLQRMHKLKNTSGFTLVELIVVLVILAIIAAFTIPAMLGYIDKTREADAINNAQYYVTAARTCITKKTADNTWDTLSDTEKVVAINEEASTTAGLSTGEVLSASYDENNKQVSTLLYADTPTDLLVLYENDTYTIVENTAFAMPDSLALTTNVYGNTNGGELEILEELGLEDVSFTINGTTYYVRADAQGSWGDRTAVVYANTEDTSSHIYSSDSGFQATYYYSDSQDQWYAVTDSSGNLSSTSVYGNSTYDAIETAINTDSAYTDSHNNTYTFVEANPS